MDRRFYLYNLVIQVVLDLEFKVWIDFLNSQQAFPDIVFKAWYFMWFGIISTF